MNQPTGIIEILIVVFCITLAVALIAMPFVVMCIDSRIAKLSKTLEASSRALAAMESMMRNGR